MVDFAGEAALMLWLSSFLSEDSVVYFLGYTLPTLLEFSSSAPVSGTDTSGLAFFFGLIVMVMSF